MPENVITVADLLRDLVQQALGEDRKTADHIPTSLALRWFSDAYREIVRKVQFLTACYIADLPIVPQVAGPVDILDRLISHDQAMNIESDAKHWRTLILRDWQYVRQTYPDLTFAQRTSYSPVDWTWDETTPGQILILPPNPTAVPGGLSLDYIQDPGSLTRLYDDDTATCTLANGLSTVLFSASVTGLAQKGDYFGSKATADDLPDSWYKIVSIALDGLSLTLAEPWGGASNASALFTLAQASLAEIKRPGLCLYAAVQYALWKYWTREDQTKAMNYQIAFWGGQIPAPKGSASKGQWMAVDGELTRIAKAAGDRPGLTQRGVNTGRAYAGVRARNAPCRGHR